MPRCPWACQKGCFDIAGEQRPLQEVCNIAEEALHWNYPPPQLSAQPCGAALTSSEVAKALSDVTALEESLDVLGPAHCVASHVLRLLQDRM